MRDNWFLYLIAVLLGGGIAAGLYFFSDEGVDGEVPFAEATVTTDEIVPLELTPVTDPAVLNATAAAEEEARQAAAAAEEAARAQAEAEAQALAEAEEAARVQAEAEAQAAAEETARLEAEALRLAEVEAAAKAEEERLLAEAEAAAKAEEEARIAAEESARLEAEALRLAEAEAAAKAEEEARALAEAEAAARAEEEARALAEAEAAARAEQEARELAEAEAAAKAEEEARLLAEAEQAAIAAENAIASTSNNETAPGGGSDASDKTAATTTVTGTNLTIEGEKPEFDVVRVDQAGSAVIAGTAMPNSTVSIMADGEKIGEATANASGEFVAILSTDNAEAQNIGLESELDGELAFSDESILILPSISREAAETVEEDTSPTIVKTTPDDVVIIQSGGPELVEQIIIDSISYDDVGGQVFVSGRGSPENEVFLYVNNTPVANTMIEDNGEWMIQLKDIEAGVYTMRADELSPDGEVISRMETPFQRAYPEDVQAAASQATTSSPTHVVQPGNSLWLIATNNYGDGLKYHQIFQANSDKIRDPDLIYPGQVFVIPADE